MRPDLKARILIVAEALDLISDWQVEQPEPRICVGRAELDAWLSESLGYEYRSRRFTLSPAQLWKQLAWSEHAVRLRAERRLRMAQRKIDAIEGWGRFVREHYNSEADERDELRMMEQIKKLEAERDELKRDIENVWDLTGTCFEMYRSASTNERKLRRELSRAQMQAIGAIVDGCARQVEFRGEQKEDDE